MSKPSQGLKALAGLRETGSWSKYDFLSPIFFENCKEVSNKMIGFKRVKNVKSKKRVFMITRPVPGAALSCQYIVLAYADVSSRKLTCNREGEV